MMNAITEEMGSTESHPPGFWLGLRRVAFSAVELLLRHNLRVKVKSWSTPSLGMAFENGFILKALSD